MGHVVIQVAGATILVPGLVPFPVVKCLKLIWKPPRDEIYGCRPSKELQWLDLKIGHQDSCPNDGHRGRCVVSPLTSGSFQTKAVLLLAKRFVTASHRSCDTRACVATAMWRCRKTGRHAMWRCRMPYWILPSPFKINSPLAPFGPKSPVNPTTANSTLTRLADGHRLMHGPSPTRTFIVNQQIKP